MKRHDLTNKRQKYFGEDFFLMTSEGKTVTNTNDLTDVQMTNHFILLLSLSLECGESGSSIFMEKKKVSSSELNIYT